MKTFARLIVQRSVAWLVVVLVVGLTAASALYASRVVQDDDLLAFLPRKNPEVAAFYDVSDRFGSMDIALVGIETKDVFEPSFLARLKDATKRLNETEGIQYALSLTSVEDFTADRERGGVQTDYLVRAIPDDAAGLTALRDKVLSRDAIVGNLVSEGGDAVMIYCFAVPGSQPRRTAAAVREVVERAFPSEQKYWGGAPFIATYIYDVTQSDLRRFAPWACGAIALLVLLTFRDLVGAGLSLLSTVMGIVLPLGLMGFLGVHTNIVLGSMPVILFALGSAYGIHLLSRFYAISSTKPRIEALREALEEVGPAILGSGLTTVFGLASFVVMDIAPMRTFGIFTALGLLAALTLALTFIPAVLVLSPVKGRAEPTMVWLSEAMARLAVVSQRRRVAFGGVVGALVLASLFFVSRVDTRLDTTAFFSEGSPPAQADAFLRRRFGGSQFVQVQLRGDMTDPLVLREVQRLADRIALVPGVASVTHVASIVAQTNEAMEDVRRVPDSTEKVRLLYGFLAGKRAVAQTVTDDRKSALITVKVTPSRAEEVEALLLEIEKLTKAELPTRWAAVAIDDATRGAEAKSRRARLVADRVTGLAKGLGFAVRDDAALVTALGSSEAAADPKRVEAAIAAFTKTEAFGLKLDAPVEAKLVAALVEVGPSPSDAAGDDARKAWKEKIRGATSASLGKPADDVQVDDAAFALEQSLGELWTQQRARARSDAVVRASGLELGEGPKAERFRAFLGHALLDLDAPTVLLPAADAAGASELGAVVTGLPVLYRGMSESVFNNQWNSLWLALAMVIGLKAILFRSLGAGILSSVPTFATLALIYGAMGLLGVRLDIGTSMLASLIIGAGDDYAVEYLWAWSVPKSRGLDEAARVAALDTGAGIWTNALMVAIGFFVLTLGEARPLQNVGGLTAAAMIAAAVATFVLCPVLARRRHYAPGAEPAPEPAADSVQPAA